MGRLLDVSAFLLLLLCHSRDFLGVAQQQSRQLPQWPRGDGSEAWQASSPLICTAWSGFLHDVLYSQFYIVGIPHFFEVASCCHVRDLAWIRKKKQQYVHV